MLGKRVAFLRQFEVAQPFPNQRDIVADLRQGLVRLTQLIGQIPLVSQGNIQRLHQLPVFVPELIDLGRPFRFGRGLGRGGAGHGLRLRCRRGGGRWLWLRLALGLGRGARGGFLAGRNAGAGARVGAVACGCSRLRGRRPGHRFRFAPVEAGPEQQRPGEPGDGDAPAGPRAEMLEVN